jgi:DNA replication and repair protein RecF
MEEYTKVTHSKLTNGREKFSFVYKPSILGDQDVFEILKQNRAKDVKFQTTSKGVHRDEFVFYINDREVSSFGSQGQQRTTALSLKLAEIDLMEEITGETPILLLDDVMSELDNDRQLFLLHAIKGRAQTFITTTTLKHLNEVKVDAKIFKIQEGRAEELS